MPNLTNTPKIINKIGDKVNASDLGRVAFTNQYSDLDGIPSQTVVNNATVTFKKNGTTVQTITNNQASDAEVNYEITKVDVGLGNVDDTADINKPVSNAVSVELGKKANKTDVYTKAETDAAISSTISSVYKYKGSVQRYSNLPTEGQAIGDVYNVKDAYHSYPADTNFAWDGSDWDALGGTVDLSTYLTKTEAASTYLTNNNAAILYLSKTDAGNTYLSKTDASSTYATKNELSDAVESVDGISTTQPQNPEAGSIYYDTTENILKIYNGNEWIAAGEGQDHVVLTRQEYEALTPEEKADPNKIYFIKGQGGSGITVYWNDIVGKPTSLSEFTNDTGFITSSSLPTKVSDLTNDSGFQTSSDVNSAINTAMSGLSIPTKVSDLTNDSGYQTASDVSSSINTAISGLSIPTKVSDLTNDSGYQTASDVTSLISESTYVGSTAPSNPTEGMLWYDTTTNILKTYDGTNWNVTSDFPGMTILEYGVSTWQDFIDADNRNAIVYCKVPSATGLRMAFLAYQNTDSGQETAEFQYYRSISSKSDSAQGDEVYIYKLIPDNGGTWNTSTRKAYSKIVAGTNMTSSYASGTLTLNANSQVDNTAYGSSWSSDTTHAPSKSAVYTALGDIITLLDNI